MSPKHVLTSSDQRRQLEGARSALDQGEARRLTLTYAPWAMDVCIWRETDEGLVAENVGLRDEAQKPESERCAKARRRIALRSCTRCAGGL